MKGFQLSMHTNSQPRLIAVDNWEQEENFFHKKSRETIFLNSFLILFNRMTHNSSTYDEIQTQLLKVVLAMPWNQAFQDICNDFSKPRCEFHVKIFLMWVKAFTGLS